jgi:hypothetical protein
MSEIERKLMKEFAGPRRMIVREESIAKNWEEVTFPWPGAVHPMNPPPHVSVCVEEKDVIMVGWRVGGDGGPFVQ